MGVLGCWPLNAGGSFDKNSVAKVEAKRISSREKGVQRGTHSTRSVVEARAAGLARMLRAGGGDGVVVHLRGVCFGLGNRYRRT